MDPLGSLGGEGVQVWDINADGSVVGMAETSDGQFHAFLCTDGNSMVDLNDAIDPASGWSLRHARCINDAGVIAGGGFVNGQSRAFILYPPYTDEDGQTVPPAVVGIDPLGGDVESWGTAINNNGDVVGISTAANGDVRVFFNDAATGSTAAVPGLDDVSEDAIAVNDDWQVLGQTLDLGNGLMLDATPVEP